jgi:hypothetical protein
MYLQKRKMKREDILLLIDESLLGIVAFKIGALFST